LGAAVPDHRLRELANFFRVLSDPQRLHILAILAEHGEQSVTALGTALDQSQPAVSHHLTILKSCGIIDFRRDGKFNYYHIDTRGSAALFEQLSGQPAVAKLATHAFELQVKFKPN
jgi:ArsR family transcriptional regulator, arsenate/arsenite/antimonite-responsive transcriptional repressor